MIRLVLLLCLCLPSAPLWAKVVLTERPSINLGPQVELFEDPSRQLTIQQVSSPQFAQRFKPNQGDSVSMGYTSVALWVKIDLSNPYDKPVTRILEQAFGSLDLLDLYEPNGQGGWIERVTGDTKPFGEREIQVPQQTFRLTFAPNSQNTYFLRAVSKGTLALPLRLVKPEGYVESLLPETLLIGGFAGLVLVMFIYHIGIYWGTRDPAYLTYSFFILSLMVYSVSLRGLSYQYLWPNSPGLNAMVPSVSVAFAFFWGLSFIRLYLHTSETAPIWDKILMALIFPALGIPLANFFTGPAVGIYITTMGTVAPPVPIILGIVLFLRGYQPATFFLIALGGSMLSILVSSMRSFGLLDTNLFTQNSMIFGTTWEIVVLSLALSYRIRKMRDERLTAQAELLEQVKREKDLIEEHRSTLERKVLERTAEIKELMDNTGQGFFSCGADLKIRPQYSKACEEFFGGPIGGLDALPLIYAQRWAEHLEVVQTLFATRGSMKDLIDLLPTETQINGLVLHLEYRLILQEETSEDRLLIVATDVTREQTLRALLRADEGNNKMILAVARDKEGFLMALEDARHILKGIKQALAHPAGVTRQTLLRSFHTLKGEMSCYGLTQVADAAHQIESRMVEVLGEDEALEVEHINFLALRTGELEQHLETSLERLRELVGLEELDEGGHLRINVSTERVEHLIALLRAGRRLGRPEWTTALEDLKNQPLRPHFRKLALEAERLAAPMGKKVKTFIDASGVEADIQALSPLLNAMVHLVRNSMDHGIERPELRKARHKSERGRLTVTARQEEGLLLLEVGDDGNGIDPQWIRELAVEKGVITAEEAATLDTAASMKLLFRPGFSSKDEVNLISGRGVGLDAVEAEAQKLGGQLSVRSDKEQGTCFRIELPQRNPSPLWREQPPEAVDIGEPPSTEGLST